MFLVSLGLEEVKVFKQYSQNGYIDLLYLNFMRCLKDVILRAILASFFYSIVNYKQFIHNFYLRKASYEYQALAIERLQKVFAIWLKVKLM
jgi:hypothetical protein